MPGSGPADSPVAPHDRGTILIVDDHAATRTGLVTLLANSLPDCRLLTAGSGEVALTLCDSVLPHLIVMDISLPGLDGIEAMRQIKVRWPDTVVIIHSTHDQQIYRDESLAAGAAAFISKSRTGSDLGPTIARLLPLIGPRAR